MTTPAPQTAVVPTNPAPPSAPAPVVPPPPPPVVVLPAFGPQWPGPGRTAHSAVLVATLITAAVAAGS